MRILFLVDCYLPSKKSSAKLIHDLAYEFSRQGHKAVVMAPVPGIAASLEVTDEDGIEVIRVRAGRTKGATKVVRAANEVLLSFNIWRNAREYLLQNRCDYIIFYSPTIFFGTLVKRLKKLWGCKSYLILRDIFPQWAVDAGIISTGLIFRFFQYFERKQYHASDFIGVQSPANLSYFAGKNWSVGLSLEILYNWAPLQLVNIPITSYRSKLGLENRVVFFYGGNIGVAQDLDNILRLAERMLHENDAFFLLVGDGSEVGRLRRIIFERNISNILIHDGVSQLEYLGMLQEFDVGLVSLDKKLTTHNFPGKLLGYMQAEMPVLASTNPDNDICLMLEEHGAALVAVNGQDDLLARHASTLIKNASLRSEMGKSSRRLLEEKFAVNIIAQQLLVHMA